MGKFKIPMGGEIEKKMEKPQGGIGTGLLNGESTKMQTVKWRLNISRFRILSRTRKISFPWTGLRSWHSLLTRNGLEQPLLYERMERAAMSC